jgi:3-oxoacyl-(acyl-carrier-protein) synthase
MRRVVITGMGCVSPNGIGTRAFWEATRSGVSGIGPITRFDPSDFAVKIAGEVKDFREEDYVPPKDRPHVSRAARSSPKSSTGSITPDIGGNARSTWCQPRPSARWPAKFPCASAFAA